MNGRGAENIQKVLAEWSSDAPCGSRGQIASDPREDLRYRVLRLLEANPHMSHREIAKTLGGSTGAVNYCVNALIEKGLVKVSNFRSNDNKLRYAYILTPDGINEKASLTASFLRRKLHEYHAIHLEISQILCEANPGLVEDFALDE